jgi:adenosylcobinamide-GDP ribazoletransferase
MIRSLLSFLTTIPVGMQDDAIDLAAEHMYLFPAIGAFIGLLAGIPAYLFFLFLPRDLAGVLSYGALQAVTGLQHLDGLLDLGDGIMTQGTPQRKIEAMKDTSLGAGGVFTGAFLIVLTTLLMSKLSIKTLVPSLVVCETASKLSMVLLAWLGESAAPGMGSRFVEKMRGKTGRFLSSLIIAALITWTALGWTGIGSLAASLLVSLLLLELARRDFKGITGDVFGASNEISRAITLIMIVGVYR